MGWVGKKGLGGLSRRLIEVGFKNLDRKFGDQQEIEKNSIKCKKIDKKD